MRYDLFKIYLKNHDLPYLYYFSVAVVFLVLRYFLYGVPDGAAILTGLLLGGVCAFFIYLQTEVTKGILQGPGGKGRLFYGDVLTVALCKFVYISLWLMILFYPLHSEIFYDHILGYTFLFFMIATITSTSAPYFPLFILEVSIAVLFGLFIWSMNAAVQETSYATFFLCSFAFYALFMGRKINLSAIELVRKQQESESAARKAEQASRTKSDFLAFMSHEIRTPISGILGMTYFLKETPLSEEQIKHINTITGCSETLLNTLNDAIDITKIESGKLKIQKKDFELHTLFRNSMKVIEAMAREKNLSAVVDINFNVPRRIKSDPYRIQQIVVNLLNNAVKFTEAGSVTLKVSCPLGRVNTLRVEIVDTGIGISAEDQKKLFMRFSQIESETSNNYIGFGLGLSISKNLVALMKGRIGVQSEEGKGTTFWFELPYDAADFVSGTEESRDGEMLPSASAMDILLVEDNRINRMIAVRLLESRGHRVFIAQSSDEALASVRNKRPDMILMDLNIPGKDGLRTAMEIFSMGGAYKDIPVVVLTANSSGDLLGKCRKAGVRDCLLKPYTPVDLYRLIEKYSPSGTSPGEGEATAISGTGANPKLTALLDVFGPEYMELFLSNSLEEIAFLISRLEELFASRDFAEMSRVAHDLKSVAGSIGYEETYELASMLEKTALEGDAAQSGDLFRRIKLAKSNETDRLSLFAGAAE